MTSVLLRDVSVEFPRRNSRKTKSVTALSEINLELKAGDRLGIVGGNGSGKTTLLRVIAGIYPPTHGSREVDGEVGSMLDLGAGMNGLATGRDYILFRSKLMGRTKALALETVLDATEFGGLGEFIDHPIDSYSSGMRMKLLFCLATAVPPQILVMDEWLSVGDRDFKELAKKRISTFVKSAEILVLASHSQKLLQDSCNRFLMLDDGQGTEINDLAAYFKNKQIHRRGQGVRGRGRARRSES